MPTTPPSPPGPPSKLDAAQIAQHAFDDTTKRLRVDAELTATITNPIDVYIADNMDSVKIGAGGPGPYLGVNNDGSINVKVTSSVASGSDGAILDGTTPSVKATVRPGSSLTASTDTALVVTLREPVTVTGSAGGTAQADKSSFVEGSGSLTPAGGVYNETIASDPTEDTAAALRITAKRGLHVNLRDSSGAEISPATAANQATANTSLTTIATNTTGIATATNQTSANTKLDTLHSDLTTLDTDLKASQPRKLQDGSGTAITSTGGALDVNIKTPSTLPVSLSTLPALSAGSAVIGHVIVDSGAITANVGTTNGLALDATLTGGTQKAIARGGAKGSTAAADVTSVAVDANTQALHTNVTNFPATQAVSGSVGVSSLPALPAGSNVIGHVIVDTAPTTTVTGTVSVNALPAGTNVIGHVIVDSAPTTAVTGPLTDTQLRATAVPVSGTVSVNTLPTGGNTIGNVGIVAGSAAIGTVGVTALPTLPAGTNVIGKVSIDQTTPGTTNAVSVTNTALSVKNSDTNGNAQYNFPAGFVRTTDEPTQLFYDPFDTSLDTTNRWNAAVSSGGGVAAAVSAGVLTIGSGTTASGYSHLSSQGSFTPTVPGWLGESHALKLEFPVTTNAYRFWGHGTVPGVPTTSAPLTDAYGFEVDTLGKMYAVVYAAGVKVFSTDLNASGKQPTDSAYHRYICYYRTDKIFFYIDTLDTPVATANFISPNVQSLPHRFLCVAGATPPSSSAVITCTGLAVWDTGKNNFALSDGTFGWRKATVSSAGALSTGEKNTLVPFAYDYISYASASTTDTYVYKSGGSAGTTVATVTITYTDSTKGTLSSIART